MIAENYCNSVWPLIYDQYNQGRYYEELAFYSQELSTRTGPVLEVACGTGMILLPLLKSGVDIFGFDISSHMLAKLKEKAALENVTDIEKRISQQNMVDFSYDIEFDAIFIPARSFLHLTTQEDQIKCLRNIYNHLSGTGVFMLNFYTPELDFFAENAKVIPAYRHIKNFPHPEGNSNIEVSMKEKSYLSDQIIDIVWRFKYGDQVIESPMMVRWIYKNEFYLLAKLAGFRVRNLYSGFDRKPYNGDGEMVWILEKEV